MSLVVEPWLHNSAIACVAWRQAESQHKSKRDASSGLERELMVGAQRLGHDFEQRARFDSDLAGEGAVVGGDKACSKDPSCNCAGAAIVAMHYRYGEQHADCLGQEAGPFDPIHAGVTDNDALLAGVQRVFEG